jgi:peptidoglycan/xylan/chitin deacetylase (PgdA/CDA1 family)
MRVVTGSSRSRRLGAPAAFVIVAMLATPVMAGPRAVASEPLMVSASPTVFSPNGDGRLETTTIRITSAEDATLEVLVRDRGGRMVRTIASDLAVESGRTRLGWRGLDDARRVVPDGRYVIEVTAVTATGATPSARTVIRIDTTPPRVRWRTIAPDPVRDTDVRLRIAFATAAPSGRLAVITADDRVVHRDRWRGSGGVVDRTWNLRDADGVRIDPGRYVVQVTARDDASNLGTAARAFRDEHPVVARTVRRAEGTGRRVALTFDDCGSARAWSRILSSLSRASVHASFFCTGPRVLAAPALARRTVREGNVVGSHGWDHQDLSTLSATQIVERLELDERAWWRTARTTAVPFLRPPYGVVDREAIAAAGTCGYRWLVLWDVDPSDWERPGAAAIASRVLTHVRAGSIVVLHVLDQTASALPAILRGLRSRGLRPVTLLELIHAASSTTSGAVQAMPV